MLFPLIEENDDLTVFMTESCNSNCVMCPMSRDSRKRGNHCSDEAWAEALAVLHKRRYRHISITGGEPFLMAERLLSLMCTLRDTQADTPVLLLTNGRALCRRRFKHSSKSFLMCTIVSAFRFMAAMPRFMMQSRNRPAVLRRPLPDCIFLPILLLILKSALYAAHSIKMI